MVALWAGHSSIPIHTLRLTLFPLTPTTRASKFYPLGVKTAPGLCPLGGGDTSLPDSNVPVFFFLWLL